VKIFDFFEMELIGQTIRWHGIFFKNAPPLSPDEQSLKAVVVVVCCRATND
jgi:hypothetical protein